MFHREKKGIQFFLPLFFFPTVHCEVDRYSIRGAIVGERRAPRETMELLVYGVPKYIKTVYHGIRLKN